MLAIVVRSSGKSSRGDKFDGSKIKTPAASLNAFSSDRELSSSEFLVGNRFTVADINVAAVVRYALPAPELFEAAPNLNRWLAVCDARPAYTRMMEALAAEPA